ncbi:hypothetical protein [Natrinema soli]|uniref:Phosphoserine phosphatase n=1 Tax=Natrinema soli TaxID=1930624 RepID=A0ABD5SMM5_9EURY|nr:hypothetical protein [Natrinema soli]
MGRVNATVRDEHLAQLEEIKESADSDISDAEAVRHIFDTAKQMNELERELRNVQATHGQKLAELRNEYESRITDLKTEIERLRNEKRTLINDREERTELVRYVEEERTLSKQKAQAGIATRAKWFVTGMPTEEASNYARV